jgi:hypothetical protein
MVKNPIVDCFGIPRSSICYILYFINIKNNFKYEKKKYLLSPSSDFSPSKTFDVAIPQSIKFVRL